MPLHQDLLKELREAYDTVSSQAPVNTENLGEVFKAASEPVPAHRLREVLDKNNTSKGCEVSFDLFCELFEQLDLNKTKGVQFKSQVQTRQGVKKISGSNQSAEGTVHTMSDSERKSFSHYINMALPRDEDSSKYLPLDPETDDLFTKLTDGILLCKLINYAVPSTIDERALNKKKLSTFTITENLTLAIKSCIGIGCHVVNIDTEDIKAGKKHLVLGLVWQVIRISVLSKVNIKATPNLLCMLEEGETPEQLLSLSPEELLIRWVNYQLKKAGISTPVSNFGSDFKDSSVYANLLDVIVPEPLPHSKNKIAAEKDLMNRADMIVDNGVAASVPALVQPKDIVQGNHRLNMAFVAELFNRYPNLDEAQQTIEIDETREEKSYRNWMNSCGVKPQVTYLYNDISSGIVLLQLVDILDPGSVVWNKVNQPPFKPNQVLLKKTENCNKVVEHAKRLNFSVVGLSGKDIADCSKLHALGLVWQMMSRYTLKMLQELSGTSKPISEPEIVAWTNEKLTASGIKLSGFKDPKLSSSLPVLEVVEALKPNTVNRKFIKTSEDPEDKLSNAKYAVSLARKVGANVYALPEDIVEVKNKMIMTLFACLMIVDLSHSK